VNNLQSAVLTLSVAYALTGALLLVILVYARLPWPAKALFVGVTSAFYIACFFGMRGLLGWASADRLPATFKLLQVRIVEPHSLVGDPGSIYLWVEALDDGNRPSGIPRAYRLPFTESLAGKTDKAASEIAAGRPQGGRAADYGNADGGFFAAARAFITSDEVPEMTGGEASVGAGPAARRDGGDGITFTPLPSPRMPPKAPQE
jgi:hypothetical protein